MSEWDDAFWNNPSPADTAKDGSTNWLSSLLGTVAPLLKTFAGPAATAIGAATNANRSTTAAQTAGTQEATALNRGIDLQTAQWLQQQQNLAPFMQAGQLGLAGLMGMLGREQPGLPGATPAVTNAGVPLPSAMPGWTPRDYQGPQGPNAGDYRWTPGQGPSAANYRYTPGAIPSAAANRWTPGQGPSAANYRYTPGQTPDAAQYASGPPQLYQGAMPGTQVPTLTGQQVLDQDPGAAFRQSEARKSLEGSAAARGDLLSGQNLKALQSRSQDLASQEYGNAWQRMMARNTEQYGRDWGQYQQNWQQGVQGTQLGLQTQAQNFGQAMSAAQLREQLQQVATQQGWSQAQTEAVFREQMAQQSSQQGYAQQMSEAQLREQVNQVASQQGWNQAQTEAVFREQMAQQSQSQNWNQALQGQQNQFTQGLQADQWSQQQRQKFETDLYGRLMEQNKLQYGRDAYSNETDYTRQQNLYRQKLGQFMLPWEQASTLANLGGQATGMYGTQGQSATNAISTLLGTLGQTQAQSTLGQALPQNTATNTMTNSLASVLSRLNA